MRYQWRVLHLLLRANKNIHIHSQVLPSFSSIPSRFTTNNYPTFPINSTFRSFTSESVLPHADSDLAIIADVFSKSRDLGDINKLLESNNFSINHDTLNAVLWKLDSDPDVARRFFQWISENHLQRLSSKSYNAMLRVLGANGIVDEFWDLVGIMKKKGFGVSKGVRRRVLECFRKRGMDGDVVKLNDLFDKNTFKTNCSSLCSIVKHNVWSRDVEKQIRDLNFGFSSEVVKLVLENLDTEPNKALIFFRWVEKSGMFKHDGCTYNAMARVLGREDWIDLFWKLVGDMRSAGFEMEFETFVKILKRFCEKEMIKDAVELYHFAMEGANKPSLACCTYLLRKVVSYKKFCKKKLIKDAVELYQFSVEGGNKPSCCKFLLRKIVAKPEEFDIELFSKVLKVFTGSGNALTDSMATAIWRTSQWGWRMEEWNNIMKEMQNCGFVPSRKLQREILCNLSKKEKSDEFVSIIEASGSNLDHWTRQSLVKGLCCWNLDEAFDAFKEMVEKEGVASAGYTFHRLMSSMSYSFQKVSVDAPKILCQLVNEKELKPWHSTYKLLVTRLLEQKRFADDYNILRLEQKRFAYDYNILGLEQKGFAEALNILGLMRNHGFPPFSDPFIKHVSERGSADDAVMSLKAMTSKSFPSTSVHLRMLEAFFKVGRHEEAYNFLSKCPSYVRNHADVLNLLCSINPKEAASSGNTDLLNVAINDTRKAKENVALPSCAYRVK